MLYKDKHFLTTKEHIRYMKDVEKLNDVEISHILRELWNCKNLEIAYMLEHYKEE